LEPTQQAAQRQPGGPGPGALVKDFLDTVEMLPFGDHVDQVDPAVKTFKKD